MFQTNSTVALAANPLDNALIAAIDTLEATTRVTLTEPQTGRTVAVFETPAASGARALGRLLGPIADLARGLDYQTVAFLAATRGDALTAAVYETSGYVIPCATS
ncbi:MAG: hypothetical protein HYV02_00340 [Deltaproteobacteria bacterium]|nr:hypothetical protein [Deltaproteobacteria bacterium]